MLWHTCNTYNRQHHCSSFYPTCYINVHSFMFLTYGLWKYNVLWTCCSAGVYVVLLRVPTLFTPCVFSTSFIQCSVTLRVSLKYKVVLPVIHFTNMEEHEETVWRIYVQVVVVVDLVSTLFEDKQNKRQIVWLRCARVEQPRVEEEDPEDVGWDPG